MTLHEMIARMAVNDTPEAMSEAVSRFITDCDRCPIRAECAALDEHYSCAQTIAQIIDW